MGFGLQKNSEAKPSKKITTKIHQNFKAISQSLVLDIFPQDFHLKICWNPVENCDFSKKSRNPHPKISRSQNWKPYFWCTWQGTDTDRNQSQGWWLRASSSRVDWLTLLQLFQLLTILKSWKSWRRVNQRTLGLEALRHYTSTLNPQSQDSTLSGGPRLMICSPKLKSRIIPLDSKVWKNIMKWSLSGSSGLGFCVNFLPWGGHPPPPTIPYSIHQPGPGPRKDF